MSLQIGSFGSDRFIRISNPALKSTVFENHLFGNKVGNHFSGSNWEERGVVMTHPSAARRGPLPSTDVLCFLACLGLSVLIAGGVMGWLNQRAGLGASRATERATAFAAWYCGRSGQASCVPQLMEIEPQTGASPGLAQRGAMAWRFRFQLSTGRGLIVRVDPAGRVRVEP
jgi:hypothetical protein